MANTENQHAAALAAIKELAPYHAAVLETLRGIGTVNDADACATVAGIRKANTAGRAKVRARLKTVTDPLAETVKAIRAIFEPTLDACEQIDGMTKQMLDRYAHQQLVIEKQRRAQEQADVDAQAETLRTAAAELRDAGAGPTAEVLELQASAAKAAVDGPARVVAVRGADATMSVQERWIGRVIDLRAFAGAVAAHRVPDSCLSVNLKALNDHAKKLGTELSAIEPGRVDAVYLQDGFAIAVSGESTTR